MERDKRQDAGINIFDPGKAPSTAQTIVATALLFVTPLLNLKEIWQVAAVLAAYSVAAGVLFVNFILRQPQATRQGPAAGVLQLAVALCAAYLLGVGTHGAAVHTSRYVASQATCAAQTQVFQSMAKSRECVERGHSKRAHLAYLKSLENTAWKAVEAAIKPVDVGPASRWDEELLDKALKALSRYLADFPTGEFGTVAKKQVQVLSERLEIVRQFKFGSALVNRGCDLCPELMVLPPGSFLFGSPYSEAGRDDDEGPQQERSIDAPFAIGIYEITQAQWAFCVREGACSSDPLTNTVFAPDLPVVNVSWEEALAYTAFLSGRLGENYRLPSEMEWEYAARAGTTDQFALGDKPSPLHEICYYYNVLDSSTGRSNATQCSDYFGDDGPTSAKPTSAQRGAKGYFASNRFGLFHMLGNVEEWTGDCYQRSLIREERCTTTKTVRGASYLSSPIRPPRSGEVIQLRVANRRSETPTQRRSNLGFRVVRELRPR